MKVSLVDRVICERIGAVLIVMVPGSGTVISVTANAAVLLESMSGSGGVEVEQSASVDELIAAGILHPRLEPNGVSRRGLLVGGAGLAGAGVLALTMPSAAMVSSESFLDGEWLYDVEEGSAAFLRACRLIIR